MNTYSHVLCSWVAARRIRPQSKATAWLAAAGAGLPDVPYLVKAAALLTRERRKLTGRSALTQLDFVGTPNWLPDLALHSLVPVVPALGVSSALPSRRTREGALAFALGWAGHNFVDLATHASDARPHLWPLSQRRWHSPVSYWDRRSHAIPVLVAEHALVLGLAFHVGMRRVPSKRQRAREARIRQLRDATSLITTFVKHPRQVGALVPTSRRTVRSMLDMADWRSASCVVELGAGTGVYTEELLQRVGPDARILAFELDPRLARRLAERLRDPRLRVVPDSAERLGAYINGDKADVIVSALPFTTLPASTRTAIFAAIAESLAPGGVLLAIQYSAARQRELERMFAAVRRRRSLANIPPAVLYACHGAASAQAADD